MMTHTGIPESFMKKSIIDKTIPVKQMITQINCEIIEKTYGLFAATKAENFVNAYFVSVSGKNAM